MEYVAATQVIILQTYTCIIEVVDTIYYALAL